MEFRAMLFGEPAASLVLRFYEDLMGESQEPLVLRFWRFDFKGKGPRLSLLFKEMFYSFF